MKNKLATLVGALALSAAASAQTWIWYPGDYEIWLGNRMNNRRTERGAFFPPFWKTDSHYVVVEFSKKLDLAEPEEIPEGWLKVLFAIAPERMPDLIAYFAAQNWDCADSVSYTHLTLPTN